MECMQGVHALTAHCMMQIDYSWREPNEQVPD
jgi:hypothetical protein